MGVSAGEARKPKSLKPGVQRSRCSTSDNPISSSGSFIVECRAPRQQPILLKDGGDLAAEMVESP